MANEEPNDKCGSFFFLFHARTGFHEMSQNYDFNLMSEFSANGQTYNIWFVRQSILLSGQNNCGYLERAETNKVSRGLQKTQTVKADAAPPNRENELVERALLSATSWFLAYAGFWDLPKSLGN